MIPATLARMSIPAGRGDKNLGASQNELVATMTAIATAARVVRPAPMASHIARPTTSSRRAPLSLRGASDPRSCDTPVERGVARMNDNPSSGLNQARTR